MRHRAVQFVVVSIFACAAAIACSSGGAGGACGPDDSVENDYYSTPATVEDGGIVELEGRVTDARVPSEASTGATLPFGDCADFCPDPRNYSGTTGGTTGHIVRCFLQPFCDRNTLSCPTGPPPPLSVGWALHCLTGSIVCPG